MGLVGSLSMGENFPVISSIFSATQLVPDENFVRKHTGRGLLSMANAGNDE